MPTWPPHYTIRRSKRAKNVSLRLYSGHGLEIILPERKRNFDVVSFLNEHREWVEKNALKLKMVLTPPTEKSIFPDKIELPSINESVDVVYHRIVSTQNISFHVQKNKVIFYGAINDFSQCVPIIIPWLKKQAQHYFGEWLKEISQHFNFSFQKLSIRSQRTVWGSCTANGNIQLNYKILFLPRNLAYYVLIHELCHTVHLNHSPAFWKMVERYVPDYSVQVKALREADQFIPKWIIQ